MILGDHTEYLAGPGLQCPGIDSRIVGLQSLRGNIVWGRVFAIHAVVNLADGLPSHLCSPDWIGRPLGFRCFPFSPPEGPLVPIIPGAIACSFPLWGWVNQAPRGGLLLTSACGGRFTALAGGGCLSTLARGGCFSTLARGGCLSTLVQGGLFPTPIRGRLASILMPSGGSNCWSPSLGRPLWVRSSTWLGHGSFGCRLPLEVRADLELAQLCQFPVIVASEPYPSCEVTETFQVLACNFLKQFSHVGHELEWGQLLDVHPLDGPFVPHDHQELTNGHLPLLTI